MLVIGAGLLLFSLAGLPGLLRMFAVVTSSVTVDASSVPNSVGVTNPQSALKNDGQFASFRREAGQTPVFAVYYYSQPSISSDAAIVKVETGIKYQASGRVYVKGWLGSVVSSQQFIGEGIGAQTLLWFDVTGLSSNWSPNMFNPSSAAPFNVEYSVSGPPSGQITTSYLDWIPTRISYVTTTQPSTEPSNQAPIASFTFTPSTAKPTDLISFNADKSKDPDGTIINYAWDYGDGKGSQLNSGPTTSHAYANPGNYTVKLTVGDNGGLSASSQGTLEIVKPGDIGDKGTGQSGGSFTGQQRGLFTQVFAPTSFTGPRILLGTIGAGLLAMGVFLRREEA